MRLESRATSHESRDTRLGIEIRAGEALATRVHRSRTTKLITRHSCELDHAWVADLAAGHSRELAW